MKKIKSSVTVVFIKKELGFQLPISKKDEQHFHTDLGEIAKAKIFCCSPLLFAVGAS